MDESTVRPTIIAAIAIALFATYSPGLTLIVTFVPAMAIAWLLTIVRTSRGILPNRERFTPWFVVMMTLGNVVGHIAWCIIAGGYFPGIITALPYVVIGPMLLIHMWNPGVNESSPGSSRSDR